jgi:hypothetical protein
MGKAWTHSVPEREPADSDERVLRVHHDRLPAKRDPRTVLGNRASRMLLAQAKLTVGASFDSLEIEADRVASEVVRTLTAGQAASGQVDHECSGPECSVHGHGSADAARSVRRALDLERAPIGAAGGDIPVADEAVVNRARGGGASLPSDFRARVEPVMGADFSDVRVHTGPQAAQLNRSFGATAFTIGNDIFFRDRMPDVSTAEGAHLLSHELTHTIQQGGAPSVARSTCGSTDPHVQRHSSFEHLMLGNVKPAELAKIGAWQNAIEQTKKPSKKKPDRGGKAAAQVEVDIPGQHLSIKKADILHVLLQELLRLRKWQTNPPEESSTEQANQAGQPLAPVGNDPEFEVVTLRLPQGMLCTYGEMNTLADYFGSVDVMRNAHRTQVRQLLQSVREETWIMLTDIFNKVADSLTKTERKSDEIKDVHEQFVNELILPELMEGETSFGGAAAFRISSVPGQLELLFGVQGTGARGGATNKYSPSLGRNACHFVPESWHAWADNHKKARALALESYTARQQAQQLQGQIATAADKAKANKDFEAAKKESATKANDALIANGFGDHFLQDSYAAGHLINKSQIMQFYIEYIDQNDKWDYFQDANWRKVQNIAYTQVLAPPTQYQQSRVEGYGGATGAAANKAMDPQSVENRSGPGDDWQKNFTELGLQVPRSLSNASDSKTRRILRWFQAQARDGKTSAKGSKIHEADVLKNIYLRDLRMAIGDMVLDGVLLTDADVAKRGRQMASMRDSRAAADLKGALDSEGEGAGEQLESTQFLKTTFRLRPELQPKKGSQPAGKTEVEMQAEFAGITYRDYLEFIQSAFLQKSTNALHDTFCKNGLTVYDNGDHEIGRVYGDDNMFNHNSSVGVAYSGETSQMSRDAILSIANTGGDGGKSEKSIVDRFPTKVRADIYDDDGKVTTPGVAMPIEAWHNEKNRGGLQGEANKWIFKSMNWGLTQKLAPGAKGAMGDLGTFFKAAKPPKHVPF